MTLDVMVVTIIYHCILEVRFLKESSEKLAKFELQQKGANIYKELIGCAQHYELITE